MTLVYVSEVRHFILSEFRTEQKSGATLTVVKIHGFDQILSKCPTPKLLIDLLDSVLSVFDHLVKKNKLVRLDTVDNLYMVKPESQFHDQCFPKKLDNCSNEENILIRKTV